VASLYVDGDEESIPFAQRMVQEWILTLEEVRLLAAQPVLQWLQQGETEGPRIEPARRQRLLHNRTIPLQPGSTFAQKRLQAASHTPCNKFPLRYPSLSEEYRQRPSGLKGPKFKVESPTSKSSQFRLSPESLVLSEAGATPALPVLLFLTFAF
jgi:hypothetical protein